jgi:hypothetical protein
MQMLIAATLGSERISSLFKRLIFLLPTNNKSPKPCLSHDGGKQ